MHDYSILKWDSDFFGFPVARIENPYLRGLELNNILSVLKKRKIKLVYWPAYSNNLISQDTIVRNGGIFVDKKITFYANIDSIKQPEERLVGFQIESHDPSIPFENLKSLAKQCGQYSRFAVDPKIPKKKFTELYEMWIHNSVTRQMADEVFVIRNGAEVIALISLKGDKNSMSGKICLLVVDQDFRRKNIGKHMVHTGLQWCKNKAFRQIKVNTQCMNATACNLYLRCGLNAEKSVNFYHFWI